VIFTYFSFSFDSLQSLQLLQVLNDVFAEINPQVLCRAMYYIDLVVQRLDRVYYLSAHNMCAGPTVSYSYQETMVYFTTNA